MGTMQLGAEDRTGTVRERPSPLGAKDIRTQPGTGSSQYVSFLLGKEAYALDILEAREIVDLPALRRLPSTPSWILGLMDLRGEFVPVVDLKKKFELEPGEEAESKVVVVVAFQAEDGRDLVVGLLADAVLDVFELPRRELGPAPNFGARFSRSYLRGITKRDGQLVMVMEATKLLADTEVRLLAEPAA